MKLFQIIASAQGGRAFGNMGQAFGLSDELIAQAVRYFVPPIAKSIEKRSQTPEGLLSVLEFLGARRYERFLDEPRIFGHVQVRQEGERILQFLFAREERIKKLIENRAKVLPIDASKLAQMFPYIAVMALGSVEVRTRRPFGVILQRLTKGAVDSQATANPYLALAQYIKKQERENKDQRRRRLFDFLGGGNIPPVVRNKQPAAAANRQVLQAS